MGKEKEDSAADDDLDLFDDESVIEPDVDDVEMLAEDLETVSAPVNGSRRRSSDRLQVKRRLDAYLERKWFRDHGWDDDDELFNDEFFSDDDPNSRQHV